MIRWHSEMNNRMGIGYFIHPVPIFAVITLAVNDHLLKKWYPSFLTGKLSDLAGVFFFPILLCALWNLGRNLLSHEFHWVTRRQALATILVTDIIFSGVKMVPAITRLYLNFVNALGFPSRVTRDPTDLVALGMGYLTWLYLSDQMTRRPF